MSGREQTEVLRALWGLQGFAVAEVDYEEAVPGAAARRVKVVRLTDLRREHRCPCCGRRIPEALFQEVAPRRWRDCSLGEAVTYVEITPWRIACCGGSRVEAFPWEAPGHRMTRRFFERVAALCTRFPIQEVARLTGLSWDTAARVDKEAIALALGPEGPSLDGLRWIGIDEVSRTGGHVYFTMVTDLQTGKVVWIGDGKSEETLREFFRLLGKKRCRKLRVVVSDLAHAYLVVIAEAVPHAVHILDRFHIIQWINEAINAVRRATFGGAPRDDLGRTLKVKKWLLLRAYEALELRHKRLLATLLARNRRLQRAYLLKEQMRGIFHYPWIYLGALRKNLRAWCDMASRSRLKPFVQISRRLRKHIEKVVAAFEYPVPLGLVEAVSGKVAYLRRQARGYRDPEYFKLKILQRCSLNENPWAQVIL